MITLQLPEKKAREIYATGSDEMKTVLEASAPEGFFKESITDRITSVEALFAELGEDYLLFREQCSSIGLKKHEVAYMIATRLYAVLNEGWVPDYDDSDQEKWELWYYLNQPGFRLFVVYYVYTRTTAGARLALRKKELGLHVDKYFRHIMLDLLTY